MIKKSEAKRRKREAAKLYPEIYDEKYNVPVLGFNIKNNKLVEFPTVRAALSAFHFNNPKQKRDFLLQIYDAAEFAGKKVYKDWIFMFS